MPRRARRRRSIPSQPTGTCLARLRIGPRFLSGHHPGAGADRLGFADSRGGADRGGRLRRFGGHAHSLGRVRLVPRGGPGWRRRAVHDRLPLRAFADHPPPTFRLPAARRARGDDRADDPQARAEGIFPGAVHGRNPGPGLPGRRRATDAVPAVPVDRRVLRVGGRGLVLWAELCLRRTRGGFDPAVGNRLNRGRNSRRRGRGVLFCMEAAPRAG